MMYLVELKCREEGNDMQKIERKDPDQVLACCLG